MATRIALSGQPVAQLVLPFVEGSKSRGARCFMYFKQFLHDETGCASYFLASRQTREALVVDPQLDIQPYLDLAAEREYRLSDVIDTHLHADHVSGNRALAQASGARIWLYESADVLFPFNKLSDDQELHLGQLIIRVVHTPGHRPEAICLLVTR